MLKAGNKHPLKESLGVAGNSGPSRTKRRRFDNVVLLREEEENSENPDNGRQAEAQRQILRAGRKRKKPTEERDCITSSASTTTASASTTNDKTTPENDENDIISELAKEFKKARLRPVFFTISSFIEQTVDEVGFTMADEPDTGVTVRLNLKLLTRKNKENSKITDATQEDDDNELSTGSRQNFNNNEDKVSEAPAPPDLIKDCCDSPSKQSDIFKSVKLETDLSFTITEESHQEINNNGRSSDFLNMIMMDESSSSAN